MHALYVKRETGHPIVDPSLAGGWLVERGMLSGEQEARRMTSK